MITLFTIPKPFEGHIAVIQRNAIQSWTHLAPRPEIILFGDETGASAAARDLGALHVGRVKRNAYGTPLISDVFSQAEKHGSQRLLCYVNADIVLLDDFLKTVRETSRRMKRFLMVGQRWDVDIASPIDFSTPWQRAVLDVISEKGALHAQTGIDYFVYTRGLWGDIPPFAIGRVAWDNWLLYRARVRGAALVDASNRVTAVHQNHDYNHIEGFHREEWTSPELVENRRLADGRLFTLQDSTHVVGPKGLARKVDFNTTYRYFEQVFAVSHPRWRLLRGAVLRVLPYLRRLRVIR